MSSNTLKLLESSGDTPLRDRNSYTTEVGNALLEGFNYRHAEDKNLHSTPFYSLKASSEVYSPDVQALKTVAQSVVAAGLVKEEDVAQISLRVTDTTVVTPAALQESESRYADSLASLTMVNVLEKFGDTHQSQSNARGHNVTINVRQVQDAFSKHEFPVEQAFLHEVGHAVAHSSNAEVKHQVLETLKSPEVNSSVAGKESLNAVLHELSATKQESSWQTVYRESQADVFSIVAIQAVHGKDAALRSLDATIGTRDGDWVSAIVEHRNQGKPGLGVDGHHTSMALVELRGKIESGEVGQALQQGTGRELIAQTAAAGLAHEFELVKGAELNPHVLKDGKLEPGLPPGVTMRDLIANNLGNLNSESPGATVFVSKADVASMTQAGETMSAAGGIKHSQNGPMVDSGMPGLADKGYVALRLPPGADSISIQSSQHEATNLPLQPSLQTLGVGMLEVRRNLEAHIQETDGPKSQQAPEANASAKQVVAAPAASAEMSR